jgi:methyl-accepting chemotaxis protein
MAVSKKTERAFRVPLFVKFLIGNLLLAALLITGGYLVVRSQTRMRDRGNYLDKHFKRFMGYVDGQSRALSSTAQILSDSDEIVDPLIKATAPSATATPPEPDAPETANAAHKMGGAPFMFKLLSEKNGIEPDLMIVVTADGRLLWASPDANLDQADVGQMDVLSVVRNGGSFSGKVLVHDGRAWEVGGVAVRTDAGTLVGGLVIGVRIERYMQQFKDQSDDDEALQHRLVLVVGGKIVASVFDSKTWPELEKQLQQDRWVKEKRGDDERFVIRLKGGDYDFTVDDVEGFHGIESGSIGQLFLLRSRADIAAQEAGIPWKEVIIGIVLSVVFALLLAAWISRPIKQFVSQSRQLLEGETDLTHRVEVASRDETADLAENINQVFGRLHDLAAGVQSAAFQVGASSAEISAASKQMLAGLKDQTMKIEGSTAAVTELSASIQQVAANAAQATDVAEKSNVAVTSAVARMQQIRAAVEDAAEKMRELGESSKRIGNIVEVIRQISEQTSLLALNASIEAAHAGEQGRGFAVVADEVSSLARRVGQSAKDIEALIQTIKEQTAAAISSMDVGTREVEGGAQLVTHTLTDLGQLISVVKDTASAVQEQAVVSDEIARNMDAVQKIAGEVLSGSEESVVQAEQLHELAFQLEQSIGGFNLDGSGSASSKRAGGNGAPVRAAKALPKRASEGRTSDSE